MSKEIMNSLQNSIYSILLCHKDFKLEIPETMYFKGTIIEFYAYLNHWNLNSLRLQNAGVKTIEIRVPAEIHPVTINVEISKD